MVTLLRLDVLKIRLVALRARRVEGLGVADSGAAVFGTAVSLCRSFVISISAFGTSVLISASQGQCRGTDLAECSYPLSHREFPHTLCKRSQLLPISRQALPIPHQSQAITGNLLITTR